MKQSIVLISLIMAVASLSACSSFSYYRQAIFGQWQLLQARQDIDTVLAAPSTSKQLALQLSLAKEIREYASHKLGLPNNNSYTQYADLERPYAVWNVVAAKPFSLSPLQHCFPFAGCVVYRGFFQQVMAQNYADSLQEQGYETYLYGVRAYSTLGWFDDPLLNTMLNTGDELYLAGLVFHELTHQVVYVKGASEFNESFATAVEELSLQQWLKDRMRIDLVQRHEARQLKQEQFLSLVLQHRSVLATLYEQPHADENAKKTVFSNIIKSYAQLKQQWQGYNGYDRWFSQQLNNAKLAVLSTYSAQVNSIKRHYEFCGLPMPEYLHLIAKANLSSTVLRNNFFSNRSQCGGDIGTLD